MRRNIFLILYGLLLISCKTEQLNKEVVLKINGLEVTGYEVERFLNRTYKNQTDTLKKHDAETIIKDLLNRYLIIADANNMQYDTIDQFKRNVKLVSDYMMTDKGGYLWNNVVWPKIEQYGVVTPEEINNRSKLYYFDVIKTTNKKLLLEVLSNDTVINNFSEFLRIKELCSEYPDLTYENVSAQWPFNTWFKFTDTLSQMQVGQIVSLLHHQGTYYYFHLNRTENFNLPEKNTEQLIQELKYHKELLLLDNEYHEIISSGKPVINNEAIDSLMAFVSNGNNIFQYPFNNKLIEYYINDTLVTIRYNDFIELFYYMPIQVEFETKNKLKEEINKHFYRDYLSNKAKILGIYDDELFLLDRQYYQNTVYYNAYIEQEITNSIRIDSLEIVNYYNHHIDKFKVPKYKIVNCFLFDSQVDAMSNWQTLINFYRNNSPDIMMPVGSILELKSVLTHYKIDMEKCEGFDKNETYIIHQLMLGEVSMCIHFKGSYALLLNINTEGEYLLNLEHVYLFIEEKLMQEKHAIAIEQKLADLRDNMIIEVNELEKCF